MTDSFLQKKIEILEARLTLAERKMERMQSQSVSSAAAVVEEQTRESVQFRCDDPRLRIASIYDVETSSSGDQFCWVGGDGAIQFLFFRPPEYSMECRLRVMPHPQVAFEASELIVNDERIPQWTMLPTTSDWSEVVFPVRPIASSCINVVFAGLRSIRPSEIGEGADTRLLAARFFGAELIPT